MMSNTKANNFIRVSYQEMYDTFNRILMASGFEEQKAAMCAEVFTTNSVEGIYTHGVNRFAKFIKFVAEGYVKADEEATRVDALGSFERWDGKCGPGPINAIRCTEAAMALASKNTIGCVALANTNHWMRAGYYGQFAAKKGFALIAWTNTLGNMPAWGAKDSRLGNNPMVFAVPFASSPIVMDTAMSQYSYGAIDLYKLKGEKLPTIGGHDKNGELTDDPTLIAETRRVLPIGFWKGAGMSLLLDVMATILSAGLATHEISKLPVEYAMSQVFIAIDLSKLSNASVIYQAITKIIDDYHQSVSTKQNERVRFPGERIEKTRNENLAEGIPVSENVWKEIVTLLA
ncbi:3-dehydro-L-gulonate 2-dehydrogenase [Pseudochryseolinea flava]|uniref:3-dehydro-L-gulonate 2-dehydrogenase n=1 Tax=Pseudochryseolinea flava TaxID=2059302 RepID=A0A364Y3G6_9BACT|nr:3-dehydro-L-gulonate 2-dehydrogenase [Pseudochryseolinea flava]RAW01269.1 3-dehydro-L-gulonate 2-dehydrogenase [Pseudochryseolinea flava]